MSDKDVQKYGFDVERAKESLQALHALSGLDATLLHVNQDEDSQKKAKILFSTGACTHYCPRFLRQVQDPIWSKECLKNHMSAGMLSDRHDGRYVYLCPENKIFISAPIMSKRILRAVMILGPVDVSEEDDEPTKYSGFDPYPLRNSETLHHLTILLGSLAAEIGDGAESYLRRMAKDDRLSVKSLERSIQKGKRAKNMDYPLASEQALARAVNNADLAAAVAALDNIFSFIITYGVSRGYYSDQGLPKDLTVVISRAALNAGVESSIVFRAAEQCKKEIAYTETHVQVYRRLRFFVEEMIGFVAALQNLSYNDQIYRIQTYVIEHMGDEIRLDTVGDAIGLSPAYLSRIFREKTGLSFVEYVNRVRIEASKAQLLSTDMSIAQVAKLCGFDTVSYFTRVFKKIVGTTPGSFRKHRGQLSAASA